MAQATRSGPGQTLRRVLTGVVLIPLVLALVLWAPQPLFAGVVALIAWLTVREYLDLAARSGMAPVKYAAWAAVVLMVIWPGSREALVLLPALALGLILWPSRPLSAALSGAASTLFGILYVGWPLALLADLRQRPNGPQWVIYLLVLIWISDTAAYFAGRAFGRHKLSPRVSPGKSWEGAAASLLCAVAFGIAYPKFFIPGFAAGEIWAATTAVAVNVAGQVGDLAESAIKRGAGVKDSGALLPGHGGMLDRIDALLFAVPVLWYILWLRSGGFFAPL